MSINLTDEIEVKTKKGKLGAAKQIFLEGDTQTVEKEIQDINSRHNDLSSKHESLSYTVSQHTNQIESNQSQITANKSAQDTKNTSLEDNIKKLNTRDDQITEILNNITVTGGASVASAVTYDNTTSHLTSANIQGAIDELQCAKIDKSSILQKSGDDENSVMSQKATTTAIADETARAKAAEEAIIFDVSANNNGAVFESLSALLNSSDLSTLIPISVRYGGMSIRFIQGSAQSSDNKYVQYRLMALSFSTYEDDWQGVDDVPTINSKNLVTSSGIKKALDLKADQDSVDSIETRLFPIENVTYSLLNGFNEIPSNGYGLSNSAVCFIIPTIYEEDTIISKVCLKRKVADTTHAFKIASVIKNSSNQLIVNTLSDSIELPIVETEGIVNDFIVDYTIPANTQVALVFDSSSLLYTDSSATACLSNSVVTAFDNLTIGNRLSNEGPYTSKVAISLYTNEVELKPIVTKAELDAERVRLEGLIVAEETARENADTELAGDITSINNDLDELKEDTEIILNGFNEIPSEGIKDSSKSVYYIFPTVYEKSTDVSLIKIKCSQSATVRKFKIASVVLNSQNQIIVQTVSEAIDIPIIENNGDITQINVDFNIPANQQVALIFEDSSVVYNSGEATLCKRNSIINEFSDIKNGSRLVTFYSTPTVYGDTISASLYYSGKQFKDFATEKELTAAITECKNYSDSQIIFSNKYLDAKRQLLNSIVVSKYKTEKMAHCSTAVDGGDGYFYVAYYASDTNRPEGWESNVLCRLSKVSICNLYDSEHLDVLKKEETVGNFTQSSIYAPYDPNILNLEGNDVGKVRMFMVVTNSLGTTYFGYRDIIKETLALDNTIGICKIKASANDIAVDMSKENIASIIEKHFNTTGATIGKYPIITSKMVRYNNAVYCFLAGLNAKTGKEVDASTTNEYDFSGCIIKSEDEGITWEIVAWANDIYSVSNTDFAMWEAAIDIKGSKVYVIFKSQHSNIAYYDLSNNTWSTITELTPVGGGDLYIGQSASKPCVYVKEDYIYAMFNADPALHTTFLNRVFRSRIHVTKLNDDLEILDEKDLYDDGSCHYFGVVNQRGRDYLCFTEDKAHINYMYDQGTGQWIFRGKSNISLCVLDIFN